MGGKSAALFLRVVDRALGKVLGDVLVQRAAARDVHQLRSAADREDRHLADVGFADQAGLERVGHQVRRADVLARVPCCRATDRCPARRRQTARRCCRGPGRSRRA